MTLDRKPRVGDIVHYYNPKVEEDFTSAIWVQRHKERIAYIVVETAFDDTLADGGSAHLIAMGNNTPHGPWARDECYVPPGKLRIINAATYACPEGDPTHDECCAGCNTGDCCLNGLVTLDR